MVIFVTIFTKNFWRHFFIHKKRPILSSPYVATVTVNAAHFIVFSINVYRILVMLKTLPEIVAFGAGSDRGFGGVRVYGPIVRHEDYLGIV